MYLMSTTTVAPTTDFPSNLSHFSEVSENEILKIIKNFPTNSGLLDPVPTFLFKDGYILLPQKWEFIFD